jgi:hypothetical protein
MTTLRKAISKKDVNNDWIESLRAAYGGYKKKSLYAWVTGSGEFLSAPDQDYDRISEQKEEMKEIAEVQGTVRLAEFRFHETKMCFHPKPDPEEEKSWCRGGHAVGGSNPSNLEEVLSELKKIASQQYSAQPFQYGKNRELRFYIEGDCAFMEHGNVRAWVRHVPKEERRKDGEYNLDLQWSAHATMIDNWNSDYKNVCLGEFYSPHAAIEEAFIKFIRFQMDEHFLNDI